MTYNINYNINHNILSLKNRDYRFNNESIYILIINNNH